MEFVLVAIDVINGKITKCRTLSAYDTMHLIIKRRFYLSIKSLI